MQMGKSREKKEQVRIDGTLLKEGFRQILETYGDIFHEWHTEKAESFFAASGISSRNWSIYMRRMGFADGEVWTLRAIAEDEGISHIRVREIAIQTKKNLERHLRTARAS